MKKPQIAPPLITDTCHAGHANQAETRKLPLAHFQTSGKKHPVLRLNTMAAANGVISFTFQKTKFNMKKTEINVPANATALSLENQEHVRGGSWINTLVNLTVSGIIFWYHEGYKEGLVTRAKLKAHLSTK